MEDSGPAVEEEKLLAAFEKLRRTRGKGAVDKCKRGLEETLPLPASQARDDQLDKWRHEMAAKVDLILMVR